MHRLPALDGLRGVAIALVLMFHFMGPTTFAFPFGWGWCGVDLFFALSGYLITRRLLESRGSAGKRLGVFYRNRALRIFPLYFAFLIAYSVVAGAPDASYWLYFCNWTQPFRRAELWSPLSHFWSLAIEEQFYLVWPFAVILLPRRRLEAAAAGLAATAALLRVWGLSHGVSPELILRGSIFRMDALLLGALAALTDRGGRLLTPGAIMASAGLVFSTNRVWLDPWAQLIGFSGLALFFAGCVQRAAEHAPRWLSWKPLRLMGRWSYGAYVLHWPLAFFLWPRVAALGLSVPAAAGLALLESAAVFAAAALSYEFFESRLLALKIDSMGAWDRPRTASSSSPFRTPRSRAR
jgi:peptidoglycan/LPS O-acetylase OafA/YrhL